MFSLDTLQQMENTAQHFHLLAALAPTWNPVSPKPPPWRNLSIISSRRTQISSRLSNKKGRTVFRYILLQTLCRSGGSHQRQNLVLVAKSSSRNICYSVLYNQDLIFQNGLSLSRESLADVFDDESAVSQVWSPSFCFSLYNLQETFNIQTLNIWT